VDTSVWIGHWRSANVPLQKILEDEQVLMHPFVIGELACGNLKNRKEIIALLHALPQARKVNDDEILFFIERHRLMGRGLGLVDAHLLATAHIEAARLWTTDKTLHTLAGELHCAFTPAATAQ
jgi:hypothetical protein